VHDASCHLAATRVDWILRFYSTRRYSSGGSLTTRVGQMPFKYSGICQRPPSIFDLPAIIPYIYCILADYGIALVEPLYSFGCQFEENPNHNSGVSKVYIIIFTRWCMAGLVVGLGMTAENHTIIYPFGQWSRVRWPARIIVHRGIGARIFEFSTNSVLHRKENSVMRSA
jgi:hypothetical protein